MSTATKIVVSTVLAAAAMSLLLMVQFVLA